MSAPSERAAHAAHRPLGYALVALCVVHLILALKLFYQRPLALFLLGFAMTVCAVFACCWKALFPKNPKRGLLLHKIMTPLIMGAMFFLVFTPIALIMRLFGKRPIPPGFDRGAQSYWIARDPAGPGPMTKQY